MEQIVINTKLDGFVWPGKVVEMDEGAIRSIQSFEDVSDVICLEALSQLGALHIRHGIELKRHVFLMKILHSTLPKTAKITGRYSLSGILKGQTDQSWLYHLSAKLKEGNDLFGGVFLFGTIDYNDNFKKDVLQSHYLKVFSCSNIG